MPEILHFSETVGCGLTVRLDSGEPCLLSVAQSGVLVKKSRFGLLGAILYNEKNTYLAAKTAMALAAIYPQRLPLEIVNPVLSAFGNAIWQCSTAAEVARTLNEAVRTAQLE